MLNMLDVKYLRQVFNLFWPTLQPYKKQPIDLQSKTLNGLKMKKK